MSMAQSKEGQRERARASESARESSSGEMRKVWKGGRRDVRDRDSRLFQFQTSASCPARPLLEEVKSNELH